MLCTAKIYDHASKILNVGYSHQPCENHADQTLHAVGWRGLQILYSGGIGRDLVGDIELDVSYA